MEKVEEQTTQALSKLGIDYDFEEDDGCIKYILFKKENKDETNF